MIVVSDTSPITNLAAIGRLDLLKELYGSIIVPRAVHDELLNADPNHPGAVDVSRIDWFEVRDVENRAMVALLSINLDMGEAEAIALASEVGSSYLLIDEHDGRRVAERLGLNPLGLLGVLVDAKRKGLVSHVKPIMNELILRANFYIGRELYRRVLATVSEI